MHQLICGIFGDFNSQLGDEPKFLVGISKKKKTTKDNTIIAPLFSGITTQCKHIKRVLALNKYCF